MRAFGGFLSLAAALAAGVLFHSGGVRAEEGKAIDCAETNLKFDAPGYEVTCEDHSDSMVGTGEIAVGVKLFTLHALSAKDITFLDVIDDRIVGSTRVFYHKTSLESDIGRYFRGSFTDWADEEDIGDFDVKRFTAAFGQDKTPIDCLAFRRLGPRRFEGIGGKTVGIACSAQGRDYAMNALKRFTGKD